MKLILSSLRKYENKLCIFDETSFEDNYTNAANTEKILERISSSNDVAYIMSGINILAEEYVYLLALNSSHKIVRIFLVSKGGFTDSYVNLSSIFAMVLMCGYERFILVHNHPSGSCDPSDNDDCLTKRILEASKLLDLKFLDHVIIGLEDFYSYNRDSDIF